MRQLKLRCHNQTAIKNKQTMVGCVINVAAACGSRKVQSEGGEICKAYFASFCVFYINIFFPISISTFSLFLVIPCCLRSQLIYVDCCACVAARWVMPGSNGTLARKHKIIRPKPICPLHISKTVYKHIN